MKLESVTIGGKRMFRLTLDGDTVRTAPAPQTLATLHEVTLQERTGIQQLQHDEAQAQAQLRAFVAQGNNSAQARADLARVQADISAATERVNRLETLADEVRDAAIEDYAEPLRRQHAAAIAAVVAALPSIPPEPQNVD